MFESSTAAAGTLPRPTYPDSSKTIVSADTRTRELARAMLRLNAEGGATEVALMRAGFSGFELRTLSAAATEVANQGFVRQVAEIAAKAPLKTDEELLAIAFDRVGGLLDTGDIVARLRGEHFNPDTIARLWPKLVAKLAPARGGRTMKGTAACRLCGCTEDRACVDERGACSWAEPDLCSHCADSLDLFEQVTTGIGDRVDPPRPDAIIGGIELPMHHAEQVLKILQHLQADRTREVAS